ncbi:MAG: hypothetical protein LBT15_03090 [Synergistaceae bacterium]|jgi:GGDEF domain-containing protein|nr:hypothetical protein [Synergistaceae bacterium]
MIYEIFTEFTGGYSHASSLVATLCFPFVAGFGRQSGTARDHPDGDAYRVEASSAMSASGYDDSAQAVSVRWLFLPPFTALLTIIVASALGSEARVPVDPALWGLTGLLFVILTILYAIFIQQEFFRGLFPVQLIAQGLLLSPLSLHVGARMLQWVGVTMTVCGAVVLVTLYYRRSQAPLPAANVSAEPGELSALPLPFAITDKEGTILSVSDDLLRMTNRKREQAEGQTITFLLPIDSESVVLDGKTWRVLQSPITPRSPAEGERYCFRLEEAQEAVAVTPPANPGENAFIDPTTSLYTQAYAVRCVTVELYRSRRYQRPIAATLLRMLFSYPDIVKEQPAKEDEVFNAWCRFVRSSIRTSDVPCLVGPRDVLVAMPETTLEMAREVAGKLASFETALHPLTGEFPGTISVYDGTVFFGSSSLDLDFDSFMKKLDETLTYGKLAP